MYMTPYPHNFRRKNYWKKSMAIYCHIMILIQYNIRMPITVMGWIIIFRKWRNLCMILKSFQSYHVRWHNNKHKRRKRNGNIFNRYKCFRRKTIWHIVIFTTLHVNNLYQTKSLKVMIYCWRIWKSMPQCHHF